MGSGKQQRSIVTNPGGQVVEHLLPKVSRLKSRPSDIRVKCVVQECPLDAVIDTAADVTVISELFYNSLPNPPAISEVVFLRAAAEGQTFRAQVTHEACVKIGPMTIRCRLHVAPIQDNMLLGMDLLQRLQATIDLKNGFLSMNGSLIPFCRPNHDSKSVEIRLTKKITCPPFSSMPAIVPLAEQWHNTHFLFEPNPDIPVLIPAGIYENRTQVVALITNGSSESKCLSKGTLVGQVSPFDINDLDTEPCSRLARTSSIDVEDIVLPGKLSSLWQGTMNSVSGKLNNVEIGLLKRLLYEYEDIFAESDLDLGDFTESSHIIDTGDALPVKCGLRRTPIHFVQEEDKLLTEMLEAGVIRPSHSSWSAAPVLVKKRDGKTRWCLDYRKLNACTKKDVYPVPMMSECLDALDGNVWFTKLDANSAYWQIPVEEASKEKTAFRTRQGLFEFNKLPFGLCNAPSTYCRVINSVLTGLTWTKVLAFVDDICVLGTSVSDHLTNLELVFQRFRHFKLKLKPRKCCLFQQEIEFLGRKINGEGMTLTDHSISTIKEWPTPKTLKELERFLGLVNFHRTFISDYSNICEPLFRLLKKKTFRWDDEQQSAFDTLKQSLVSPVILTVPQKDEPFILDTDASNVAIGAQLSQVQGGAEKVIAFASFALTACQRRYCTTRKELLSVVRFTNHFRHYLLGRQFLVRTDHHSLLWLMNFKRLEGQLARWHEELSRFDMVVQHRPGKKHQNADALSRIPNRGVVCLNYEPQVPLHCLPCKGCEYCQRIQANWNAFETDVDDVVELRSGLNITPIRSENVRTVQTLNDKTWSPDEVATLQKEDPNIGFLHKWLTTGESPSKEFLKLSSPEIKNYWVNRDMCTTKNDILYWRAQHNDLLLVPEKLKETVIGLCHDLPSSGHQGVEGTKKRIKQKYHWYSLSKDTKVYVTGCKSCNMNKHPNKKNRCPLTINQAGYPLEKVHIDFMGPFPRTRDGNEHLLVIVDSFSKWCELIPLPSQEAETTAWAMVKDFFLKFGCPIEIVSDQGRNFESDLFAEMCKLFRIHKLRTTAYRPSANGQAERMNRTLLQALRAFVDEKHQNWDTVIPFIASAIRSSVNKQTGFTPNKLMLGREVMMPVELVIQGAGPRKVSHIQFIHDIQRNLDEAHSHARKNLKVKTKQMKRDYDLRVSQFAFKEGDVVYMLDRTFRKGLSPKLGPVWAGPCLIVELFSPYVYRVQLNNRTTKVVNHDRLKICHDRILPPWLTKRKSELAAGLTPTYCYCGLPDDGQIMIQCDSCLEWYHGRCASIDRNKARELKEFLCNRCLK